MVESAIDVIYFLNFLIWSEEEVDVYNKKCVRNNAGIILYEVFTARLLRSEFFFKELNRSVAAVAEGW